MTFGSLKARALDYDACYGDKHDTLDWPDTVLLQLYNGDPLTSGVALTSAGGYVPVIVPNTSDFFPNANLGAGTKGVAPISFAVSTGAWSAAFDHWAFIHGGDGVTILDTGTLTGGPFTVSAAGTVLVVTVNLS